MKPTPLVPALPDGGGAPRWSLAASVALHALLLAAVLWIVVQPPPPSGGAEPSFQLVFQPPSGGAPSPQPNAVKAQPLPPAQPADLVPPPDAEPGIPAPAPLTTPDPAAANSPPPAEAAAPPAPTPSPAPPSPAPPSPAPPSPAPPSPAPAVVAPASPPPAQAQPDQPSSVPLPLDIAPTAEPPAVRLALPSPESAPAAPEPIMPQPPPPLPTPAPQPAPRPQPRPASRPSPRQGFGTLANPMDLSLAPAAPRPAARGVVASRSLDLSPPTERQGPVKSDPYAQIRAANASADWNRGLLQYWLSHRYYPEQAAAEGDEGEVTIKLTVNRSGKVESVEIVSKSGSQWLDMAAVGTWRNARLPPFTSEMREDRITFPIPIHYYLVRR